MPRTEAGLSAPTLTESGLQGPGSSTGSAESGDRSRPSRARNRSNPANWHRINEPSLPLVTGGLQLSPETSATLLLQQDYRCHTHHEVSPTRAHLTASVSDSPGWPSPEVRLTCSWQLLHGRTLVGVCSQSSYTSTGTR